MKKLIKTRAYINIALIKYWGKEDEYFNLSCQPSISYTLNELYTDSDASFNDKDVLIIDGKIASDYEQTKIKKWLDKVRKLYNLEGFVKFDNKNNVPFKAGLASSASSYAAMSLALNELFNLGLSKMEISKIARIGSGSASRSIFGGFSKWIYGNTHDASYAESIDILWPEFKMFAIITKKEEKKVSSRDAMMKSIELLEYNQYKEKSFNDYELMLKLLKEKDINKVGMLAEENAINMHKLINLSNIDYFDQDTRKIMEMVLNLRSKNIPVYYTIDAGPNVKIITLEKYSEIILKTFSEYEIISFTKGNDAHVRN